MKEGDIVEIVNYGSLAWVHKTTWDEWFQKKLVDTQTPLNILQLKDGLYAYDTCPEMVGQVGIIKDISVVQGEANYALREVKGKTAWYSKGQLKFLSHGRAN